MTSGLRNRVCLLLAGSILSVASGAHAQTRQSATPSDAGASDAPDEILVTAQKREQRAIDVPSSITVISERTLSSQKILRLEDIAALAPALSIRNSGAGRNVLTIRGINSGSQANTTVGIYLDDVAVGSSNRFNNGSAQTGDFDTFDIARIEVLEGPQGTLYGTNTLGGLVRYISNAPDPGALSGKIEVGAVDVAHGEVGSSFKGVVNIPVTDNSALRVSGFRRIDPGYTDIVGQYPRKNVNHDRYEGGRATYEIKPVDDLTMTLLGYYQHIRSGGTNVEDLTARTLIPVVGEYDSVRIFPQTYDSNFAMGALTVKYDFGFASLTSISSYSEFKNKDNSDYTAFLGGFASSYGLTSSTFAVKGFTTARTRKVTEEVRLVSRSGQPFEWQLGGFYNREKGLFLFNAAPYTQPALSAIAGQPVSTAHNPQTFRDLAAFANGTYHFTSALDLTLGARINNIKQDFVQYNAGVRFPVPVNRAGKSNENAFTYLISPSWHVTADTMVYARVAKGYRAGGPNAVPGTGVSSAVPLTVDHDQLLTYEAGFKTIFADRKVTINASLYHIDWKDIQLSTTVANIGVTINGGSADVDGAQLTFNAVPVPGLTFSGALNYNDARLAENVPILLALKGDRLPTVPKIAGSLNVQYEHALGGAVRGTVGASYRYSGDRQSSYSQAGTFLIPHYSTADLRAGIEAGTYSFEIVARNVFDKRAYSNIGSYTNLAGFLIQPRTIGFYVTKRF